MSNIYAKSSHALTPDEIARMRAIVEAHGGSDQAETITKEFDLNNPPKKPYAHQKFPLHVFKGDKNRIVKDEKELAAALKAGYSEKPPAPVREKDEIAEALAEAK